MCIPGWRGWGRTLTLVSVVPHLIDDARAIPDDLLEGHVPRVAAVHPLVVAPHRLRVLHHSIHEVGQREVGQVLCV